MFGMCTRSTCLAFSIQRVYRDHSEMNDVLPGRLYSM